MSNNKYRIRLMRSIWIIRYLFYVKLYGMALDDMQMLLAPCYSGWIFFSFL